MTDDNKTKLYRIPDKYAHVYTCTNLSAHLDNVSHDVVSHFLKRGRITPAQVWAMVRSLIKDSEESCLIIDDSVQNKQYSKTIDLVKRQYSGAVGGLVRGIGVVNLVHTDGKEHYPIDYLIRKIHQHNSEGAYC